MSGESYLQVKPMFTSRWPTTKQGIVICTLWYYCGKQAFSAPEHLPLLMGVTWKVSFEHQMHTVLVLVSAMTFLGTTLRSASFNKNLIFLNMLRGTLPGVLELWKIKGYQNLHWIGFPLLFIISYTYCVHLYCNLQATELWLSSACTVYAQRWNVAFKEECGLKTQLPHSSWPGCFHYLFCSNLPAVLIIHSSPVTLLSSCLT